MSGFQIDSSDPAVVKLWSEDIFRETFIQSYFGKFMGANQSAVMEGQTSYDSVVYVKTDLEKGDGDEVTMEFIPRIIGDGVKNDEVLEGKEVALKVFTDKLTLDLYRQAIKDKGPLHRKRVPFDVANENRVFLEQWGAEKLDKECFAALRSSPTRVFYEDSSGDIKNVTSLATAQAGLDNVQSRLNSFRIFAHMKAFAKRGGYDSATGERLQNPIKPIMVNGKPYYVLLVSDDVLVDLRTSAEYEQANREAEKRSSENPIFTGAEIVYNGVVVHAHEQVPIALDGGTPAALPWSHCHFLGQGALAVAFGMRPYYTEDEFDYKKDKGIAWNCIFTVKKPVFKLKSSGNNFDYGCFSVAFTRDRINDPA